LLVFKLTAPAFLAALVLIPLAWGDDPPAQPKPASTADQLVEQLGDRDFRKRDAAVKRLEALGPAALPALRKAEKHSDPEIRRRVSDLIPTLEVASLLAPKRVTLNVKKKSMRQVFDEVTKQTGYKIEFWVNNEQQLYDFEINDQPFWPALDQLGNTAGLVLQQGYGDDRIRMNQQDGYVPYVCYDGPIRVVANSFNHYRNVDFSFLSRTPQGARRSDTLSFTFSVFVEPRMPLLGIGPVKLLTAEDDQKGSMVLPSPNGGDPLNGGPQRWVSRYGNGYRSYSHQAQVQLAKPSEKAQVMKLIQGTVPVLLLAQQKPELVTDNVLASKGKKVTLGTTSFAIEDVTETPAKQYQLKMAITEQNKDNPNDYTWINSLYQRIELQDENGNKYQMRGNSWGGQGPNHANVTFTYANPNDNGAANPKVGPPSKLVYFQWSTIQHQVKFEFRDLPLP
jgi:hypothetical protein